LGGHWPGSSGGRAPDVSCQGMGDCNFRDSPTRKMGFGTREPLFSFDVVVKRRRQRMRKTRTGRQLLVERWEMNFLCMASRMGGRSGGLLGRQGLTHLETRCLVVVICPVDELGGSIQIC